MNKGRNYPHTDSPPPGPSYAVYVHANTELAVQESTFFHRQSSIERLYTTLNTAKDALRSRVLALNATQSGADSIVEATNDLAAMAMTHNLIAIIFRWMSYCKDKKINHFKWQHELSAKKQFCHAMVESAVRLAQLIAYDLGQHEAAERKTCQDEPSAEREAKIGVFKDVLPLLIWNVTYWFEQLGVGKDRLAVYQVEASKWKPIARTAADKKTSKWQPVYMKCKTNTELLMAKFQGVHDHIGFLFGELLWPSDVWKLIYQFDRSVSASVTWNQTHLYFLRRSAIALTSCLVRYFGGVENRVFVQRHGDIRKRSAPEGFSQERAEAESQSESLQSWAGKF